MVITTVQKSLKKMKNRDFKLRNYLKSNNNFNQHVKTTTILDVVLQWISGTFNQKNLIIEVNSLPFIIYKINIIEILLKLYPFI